LLCCDPLEIPIETVRAYYQHSNAQPIDRRVDKKHGKDTDWTKTR
jgi:hypothetical protein